MEYRLSASDYITDEIFDVHKCNKCLVMATFPLLTNDEMRKYYQKTYYGKRKTFVDSLVNVLRCLGNDFDFKTSKSVLDIGCGTGSFLKTVQRKGWKISGTEFAPKEYIDPDVYPYLKNKTIDQCGYPDQSFDVVTMWHLLEHVDDPTMYLRESHRLLKPGGKLVIEVPNIDSWQAKLTRTNWFNVEVPRHRFHFSPESLSSLFRRTGFDNIKISYGNFIYNIYGSAQSFLNILSKRKNFMFDFLNGKMSKEQVLRNKTDFLVMLVGIIPVTLLATLLCCGEMVFKRGGIMLVQGVKK